MSSSDTLVLKCLADILQIASPLSRPDMRVWSVFPASRMDDRIVVLHWVFTGVLSTACSFVFERA